MTITQLSILALLIIVIILLFWSLSVTKRLAMLERFVLDIGITLSQQRQLSSHGKREPLGDYARPRHDSPDPFFGTDPKSND